MFCSNKKVIYYHLIFKDHLLLKDFSVATVELFTGFDELFDRQNKLQHM